MNPNLQVVIFTAIELVALSAWLVGSGVHITVLGGVLLTVGLFFEHFVAFNVGTGQPTFRFPLRRS